MIQCEKCGKWFDRTEIKTFPVNKKKEGRTTVELCKDCLNIWGTTAPSEWVKFGDVFLQRIYWPCDFCREIFQHQKVQVVIRADQPPPLTEWVVCEECLNKANAKGDVQWMPAKAVPGVSQKTR